LTKLTVNVMPQFPIKNILVVDDDKLLAGGIQKLLVRSGYVVQVAHHGKDALQWLAAERMDLVITDIFMEEMEGLETITAIREQFPQVRVMAMSGGSRLSGMDYLEFAGVLGAEVALRKPFALDTLLDLIRLLEHGRLGVAA
jgi:CheY-like chemotaxis protein